MKACQPWVLFGRNVGEWHVPRKVSISTIRQRFFAVCSQKSEAGEGSPASPFCKGNKEAPPAGGALILFPDVLLQLAKEFVSSSSVERKIPILFHDLLTFLGEDEFQELTGGDVQLRARFVVVVDV